MSLRILQGISTPWRRDSGKLDQMKKDFVSQYRNDLKGPLASTRETVHILLEEFPALSTKKQRRLLSLCLKSSEGFRNDWQFAGCFADGSRYDGLQN
jgi:hypothetical protein